MNQGTVRFGVVLLVAGGLVASEGRPASAQCVTSVTGSYHGTYTYIVKTVPAATYCHLVAFNGHVDCFPGGNYPPAISMTRAGGPLSATNRPPFAASPSCRWQCRCPTGPTTINVTTDGGDALPVELLEFSVD